MFGAATVGLSPATSSVIWRRWRYHYGNRGRLVERKPRRGYGRGIFAVTGPDSGRSGTVLTDGSGTATLTIVPTAITSSSGDTFRASINGGTIMSNTTTASCSSLKLTRHSLLSLYWLRIQVRLKQVVLSVLAAGGLFSVVVNAPPTANATVSVPAFDRGSTQALGVTATKVNQSASAVVELTVTDLSGHVTVFDPVFATITIPPFRSNHTKQLDFHHREVAQLRRHRSNGGESTPSERCSWCGFSGDQSQ